MFTFRIEPDGGEAFQVTAKSRDLVRWEQGVGLPGRPAGRPRSLASVQQDMSMSALSEIAFVAARRAGKFDGDLHGFQDACEFELISGDEAESDPTQLDR
jgi:hypothetical protein